MADETTHQDAPPVGEEIHLPGPSLVPLFNAAGISLVILGLSIGLLLIVVGGLLFVGTTIRWIADARREMDSLPLEH